MTNKPKAKGTAAETAVVRWLHANNFTSARRIVMEGGQTTADVYVSPWLVLQVKAYATVQPDTTIDKWLDQADEQGFHSGQVCRLVVKRPGKSSPEHWWLLARIDGCVVQLRFGEAMRRFGDGRLFVA